MRDKKIRALITVFFLVLGGITISKNGYECFKQFRHYFLCSNLMEAEIVSMEVKKHKKRFYIQSKLSFEIQGKTKEKEIFLPNPFLNEMTATKAMQSYISPVKAWVDDQGERCLFERKFPKKPLLYTLISILSVSYVVFLTQRGNLS